MTTKINWNETNTDTLLSFVTEGDVVSQETVAHIADEMGTSPRSIGSKLRKIGFEVEKATGKKSAWSAEQESALEGLISANAGKYTYKELAEIFENGAFSAKQIQGKVLNMELTGSVRKAEKVEAVRTYTEEQEAKFLELVASGASVEVLAGQFNKSVASIRGKALSFLKAGQIDAMPHQEVSNAKETVDVLADLDVENMTVAEIAEATSKTERGIKQMLSRRGVTASDYDGAARRAKLDSKA